MFSKTTNDPLRVNNNKKNNPLSNTTHPFLPMYKDTNPAPQPIDQFAPYLAKKLAKKRSKVSKSDQKQVKNITSANNRFLFTTSASKMQLQQQQQQTNQQNMQQKQFEQNMSQPPQIRQISITVQKSSVSMPTFKGHLSLETTFDSIASGSSDVALNRLVEENLLRFFDADKVFFYHDISAVQLLYCPSSGAVCPHGGGLVGYCHFNRKIQNIQAVVQHVAYSECYDAKHCEPNSKALVFPIFDTQNNIRAVVEIFRNPIHQLFTDADEKAVEYLQNKFQLYSRWLFQPIISNNDISDLIHVQRISLFIEAMEMKLTRMFNCKTFELWIYHSDSNEIFQFSDNSNDPIPVRTAESGVVGHAMLNMCSISLTCANLHSAYHQRSDGNGDQSILMMPVKDQDAPIVYGLVLRGKRIPNFFTDVDEKILAHIAPLIISSLNSSERVEKSFKSLEEAKKTTDRLRSLLEVAEVLSGQLQIQSLIESIMTRACDLVKADRCSLFMVNENHDKLVTSFHGGLANSIEIPINSGIVGFTATTGQILNIKDAYEDPRFNRQTDLKTGYKTQNLLCVPIFDEKSNIRGVTEMINKIGGVFDSEDERLIQVFNVFVGISIENARLYRASIDLSLQLRSILEISQKISQTTTLKQLLENILKNARKVIGAGRAMIYLIEHSSSLANGGSGTNSNTTSKANIKINSLNSKQIKFDIFALDEDIDAKMSRMNRTKDTTSRNTNTAKKALVHSLLKGGDSTHDSMSKSEDGGRHTLVSKVIADKQARLENDENRPEESMIVVPIVDNDHQILGAALMQWKKKNDEGFTNEDLKLLDSFSVFISISLERSRMMAIATYGEMELKLRDCISEPDRQSTQTPQSQKLEKIAKKMVISPEFSIPEIKEKYDPDLIRTGFCLFDGLRFRETFNITNERLFCFLYSIKEQYFNVEFHNWDHAIDVASFMTHMLVQAKLINVFTPFEMLALITSCICHDAGHSGNNDSTNNDENAISQTPFGILFKNHCVMETLHCTVAINVISEETNNIFHSLSHFDDREKKDGNNTDVNAKSENLKMWKTVISLILSTDMTKHFKIIEKANQMRENGQLWSKTEKGRRLAMKILMKAADLSNVTREFELADRWSETTCAEFYRYGDPERVKGIENLANIKSNDSIERVKSKIGYISAVCLPLFETLSQMFPQLIGMTEKIKYNLSCLREKTEPHI